MVLVDQCCTTKILECFFVFSYGKVFNVFFSLGDPGEKKNNTCTFLCQYGSADSGMS